MLVIESSAELCCAPGKNSRVPGCFGRDAMMVLTPQADRPAQLQVVSSN